MRTPWYLTIAVLLSCFAPDVAADPYTRKPPAFHVGLGVRALAHDPTAVVLAGKVKLLDMGRLSTSLRAALLVGDYVEGRAPITVEGVLLPRVVPFLGIGLAYNTDHLGVVDPMVSGGLDVWLARRVVANATINIVWQRDIGDTDKEGMGSIGFVF